MKTIFLNNENYNVGKIACVGKNYLEHAKELGDAVPEKPVVFLKPSSSIIFSDEPILYPNFSKSLHYETELVLLVGKDCKNVKKEIALDYISAYTVGLDMTLRDLQSMAKKNGHPWTIAKCFDTSTCLGNFIPKSEIKNPDDLSIRLKINNEIRQDDNTKNMIFDVATIVEYLSGYFTLEKGDLIFTGTPKGVGEVKIGDKLEADINDQMFLSTKIKSTYL